MAQYGLDYRGRHITVLDSIHSDKGGVACTVHIGSDIYPNIKGAPFANVGAAQAAGAAFARALIDAMLDGDAVEHQGYFIRTSSHEQRDGSWLGGYQLHRNDNPVPFRRATCNEFRGNSSTEAEEHAITVARQAVDADIAAGKL